MDQMMAGSVIPPMFLDIAHQVEILDLVREMNRTEGRTVVLVLHDLDQACRYADYLVAMKEGRIAAAGSPQDVMSEDLVRDVFGVESCIQRDPLTGTPVVMVNQDIGSAHAAASLGD